MNRLGRMRRRLDLRLGGAIIVGGLALASAVVGQQTTQTMPKGGAAGQVVYVPRPSTAADALMSSLMGSQVNVGAPKVSSAGGVRAVRAVAPTVMVLAPPKPAHSLSTQPTLYWYLSEASNAPVRLSVRGLNDTKPALEVDLGWAPSAGVYATSLADYGIQLQKGTAYRWSVALEVDPSTSPEEPVAQTVFATAEPDPALSAKLAGEPMLTRIQTLAQSGYWYDAIHLLTQQMVANDGSAPWRDLHAALLDQVGLKTVAAFERGTK